MRVSPTQSLTLKQIAELWAQELKGTPSYNVDTLLAALAAAVLSVPSRTPLAPIDPLEQNLCRLVKELRYRESDAEFSWYVVRVGKNPEPMIDPDGDEIPDAEGMLCNELLKITRTRDRFLQWIDDNGYQRPAFWDGNLLRERADVPAISQPDKAPDKRGRKCGTKRQIAVRRLREVVGNDLERLRKMSESELSNICGTDPERERHIHRNARDDVLNGRTYE